MSNHEDTSRDMVHGSPTFQLLTPKATSIAAFAVAVLSLDGQGSWTMAVQALLWGPSFGNGQVSSVMTAWALATLLMTALAALLARRTINFAPARESWECHLARASLIVAAVSACLSVLGLVGSLLQGG